MNNFQQKISITIIDEFEIAAQRPDSISVKINMHVLDFASDDTSDEHMTDIMEAKFELDDALMEGKNGVDEQLKLAAAYARVATHLLSHAELKQTFPKTKALFDSHKGPSISDDIDCLQTKISP